MTREEMLARIAAINARCKELGDKIKAATKEEEITAARSEMDPLIEERGRLNGQMLEMTRSSAEAAIAAKEEEQRAKPTTKDGDMKLSKRQAMALSIGLVARNHQPSDAQKRALDTTLTTTATTYSAATTTADGVNNGGIFINTTMLLDLLREDKKLTPIMDDILFTNVKGLTVYPYRASRGTAQVKTEGKGVNQDSMEFKNLSLIAGELSIEVAITDEVEALADIDLGAYLLNQIEQDLAEDWSDDLIHGTGADKHVAGVLYGLTATAIASGKEMDGAIKLVHSLKGKYRRNAKLYVSQSFYDAVVETKDTTGRYEFNVFNANGGWVSCDGHTVAIDETLDDGEVVFGNIAKFYKANLNSPLGVKSEYKAHEGVTIYVAKEFCNAAPFPGAFAYGKVSA